MRAKTFILATAAMGAVAFLSANAKAVSLDTLIASGPNNMIMVGNVVYSDFSYGGTLPSNVVVNTTANGLSFTTTTGGFTSGSSVISYNVAVTGNDIQSIGLDFQATATAGAVADVGETVTDNNSSSKYSLQVIANGNDPTQDSNSDSVTLDPTSNSLHVIKSIDVETDGTTPGAAATITLVDNTYTQGGSGSSPPVPEPMSLALLPLALMGLGLRKKLAR